MIVMEAATTATLEVVAPPWWQLLFMILGMATGALTLLGFLWRIAKPHAKTYVESIVQSLHEKADATNHQLTTNHHASDPPTVLDRIDNLARAVDNTSAEVGSLRRDFNTHETGGRQMMASAVKQLQEQGVTLHVDTVDDDRGEN